MRGEYSESVPLYEQATALTPKDGLSQYRLGVAYSGQASEAARRTSEAVEAENAARRRRASQIEIDDLAAITQGISDDAAQKRDKAIDSLAKAVAIGGVVATPARAELERLYKIKNNDSLAGLDTLINAKKAELQ
jgi:hypothetical protein